MRHEGADGKQHAAAHEMPIARVLARRAGHLERDHGGEEHHQVVEHEHDDVEREVRMVLPARQLAHRQHLRVDRRDARRTEQLDHVHSERKQDDAGESDREAPLRGEPAQAFEDLAPLLRPRDLADRLLLQRELAEVVEACGERDQPDRDPDPDDHAEEQQRIEPRRHDQVVDQRGGGHERHAEGPAPQPVGHSDEQPDQEHERPHGARIESVDRAERHGERGQREISKLHRAEERQPHRLRQRARVSGSVRDGGPDLPAREQLRHSVRAPGSEAVVHDGPQLGTGRGVVEIPLDDAAADHDERNGGIGHAVALDDPQESLPIARVARDLEPVHANACVVLLLEAFEEGRGTLAVGAAECPEEIDVDAAFRIDAAMSGGREDNDQGRQQHREQAQGQRLRHRSYSAPRDARPSEPANHPLRWATLTGVKRRPGAVAQNSTNARATSARRPIA
jgi:hypothetical protein